MHRARLRKALTHTAAVLTAATALVVLTGSGASAADYGNQVRFTLAQADWYPGDYMVSITEESGENVELLLQTDGNLVIYNYYGTPMWASGTNGKGVTHLDWSQSGYAKLLNSGNGVVCTLGALKPSPGGFADLDATGSLDFYDINSNLRWSSGNTDITPSTLDYCYT
ncbi:hypothetical protein [Kitasatospora viridis]|uniref:D-mannose binding lectin n=1 Tax=Kitasatospora viridis TaxID=281105 RepID=A0A561UC15_9ACTN|nr:hypothetical protein [Kitasatospora viridis]TWF96903.1 D-mannose binding lectin [Kitasatospora viridis]